MPSVTAIQSNEKRPILHLARVRKEFPVRESGLFAAQHTVKAVNDISLSVFPGETVGLVGESGCGKSTLARLAALLYQPDSGEARLHGQLINDLTKRRLRKLRRHVQMIFQDPFAALNPRLPISAILTEPLAVNRLGSRRERREKAASQLEAVGLHPQILSRYPHEFSGGQRQRICIARALMLEPELIIADEAVSALDVSVQSQILNLLADIKEQHGLAYLFIGHDLAVIEHLADRVAVMYLGRFVELAPSRELFNAPQHPYTQALMAAIPQLQTDGKSRMGIVIGDVPSPLNPPPGCPYHTRCPKTQALCKETRPKLEQAPNRPPGHQVACHFPEVPPL